MEGGFFSSLPAGYRFKPRDEELVDFYLKRKIYNRPLPPNIVRDVDLYNYDPCTLTAMNDNASSNGVLTEWYFFTPRDRKYPKGNRPTRSAGDGYWKATGKPHPVFSKGKEVGSKRSLAFFRGKSPNGEKTDWIMHEYVLTNAPQRQRLSTQDMQLDDWVLCRVYRKGQRLKPGTPVEGSRDKNQEEANESAIVVHSDFQDLGNGIPPNALNTLMPQQVLGQNPTTSVEAPTASMLPNYNQFQPPVPLSLQFLYTDPSILDFTESDWFIDEVQMLGNVIQSDDLDVLVPQETFSMPFHIEHGDYMLGQNPVNFGHQRVIFDQCNFIPTSTPMESMPPYHQFQPHFQLQVPPMQQLPVVNPTNVNFATADRFDLDTRESW